MPDLDIPSSSTAESDVVVAEEMPAIEESPADAMATRFNELMGTIQSHVTAAIHHGVDKKIGLARLETCAVQLDAYVDEAGVKDKSFLFGKRLTQPASATAWPRRLRSRRRAGRRPKSAKSGNSRVEAVKVENRRWRTTTRAA